MKTSKSPVIRLKKEDLQGINGAQGSKPVIAVLSYLDVNIHWILADASKLRARDYSKSSLKIFGMKDIESEMNKQFFTVIEKHQSSTMLGTNLRSYDMLRATEVDLANQPFHCLIGRETMANWHMHYNGQTGQISISD